MHRGAGCGNGCWRWRQMEDAVRYQSTAYISSIQRRQYNNT